MKSLTPFGVFDWYPEEMLQFDSLNQVALELFRSRGYEKVRTPIIEYYDVLEPAMGPQLKKQSIRFLNQHAEVLVLRPDNTLPIARMVGQKMKPSDTDALRLCYTSPVFRNIDEQSHNLEIFQAGVELIGPSSEKDDADVISLCVDTIQKMGIDDYVIEIGHHDFMLDYPKDEIDMLKNGDYLALGHIPARGGVEVVTDHAYLTHLHGHLTHHHDSLMFNKGLVKGFHYYSGVLFEIISSKYNRLLASGGRYDSLVGQFGVHKPAIGFSIHLNDVQYCLDRSSD